MFIIRLLISIFFSTVIFITAYGQDWPKIYGDNIHAYVGNIHEDYDKGYIIGGSILSNPNTFRYAWIIKTNINGNILWDKKIGNGIDQFYLTNFEKTFDEGIIISGATSIYDIEIDPIFIKLNKCGEVDWCTIILSNGYNTASGILTLSDGSHIGMLKYYGGDYQNIRISLIKIDSLGEPVWIKHLAQEDSLIYNEEGYYLIRTSDNNCIVSGHCFYPGMRPFWIKTDTTGNQIWDLKWSGGTGSADQIIESSNGDFYVAGGLTGTGRPMTPSLYKFDKNGNPLYQKYLLGDTIVGGGAIPLCFYNDSTLITGIQWRVVQFPVDEGYSEVLIIDTTGNILKRKLLLEENKIPGCVITTFDNKILVSGNYVVDDNWDIYLWKLNSDLEDDTLYTQNFTYDSLCPYQITSDTIDLECGLHVAIEDIPLKEEYDKILKIFPNPADKIVNCQLSIRQRRTSLRSVVDFQFELIIEIYNVFGRKMEEVELLQGQDHLQINVSSYPAGLYIAVLRSAGKILGREKFVVVK